MVFIGHLWLLSTLHMASAPEDHKLIIFNFNLFNSIQSCVADGCILESVALDDGKDFHIWFLSQHTD